MSIIASRYFPLPPKPIKDKKIKKFRRCILCNCKKDDYWKVCKKCAKLKEGKRFIKRLWKRKKRKE